MKLDADTAYAELIRTGNEWAEAHAEAQQMEEMRRPLRSQFTIKFLNEGMATNKAEALAQGSKEYETHITAMVEKRRIANRARVKYDSQKVLAELRRSEAATQRAELENLR